MRVDPESLPFPLFRARLDGRVTWSNAALRNLLEAEVGEAGDGVDLAALAVDEGGWASLLDRLAEEDEVTGLPVRIHSLRGAVRHVEYHVRAERAEDGTLDGVAGALLDVEVRARRELRLRHAALHDSLTGLANRTLLLERLAGNLEELRREPGHVVAVMFLDLDGFKEVNDTLGHEAGDEVLREVADALRSAVRPRDTVARFGGDEFVVVLADLPDVEEAVGAARRVVDSLSAVHPFPDEAARPLRASAGVSLGSDPATSPATLIQEADEVMYRVKGRGRGGIRFQVPRDAGRASSTGGGATDHAGCGG